MTFVYSVLHNTGSVFCDCGICIVSLCPYVSCHCVSMCCVIVSLLQRLLAVLVLGAAVHASGVFVSPSLFITGRLCAPRMSVTYLQSLQEAPAYFTLHRVFPH